MSKKANPAAIGVFVVGAVVLAVVSLLMFGKGNYFAQKSRFVLYFDDSVNGLELGAPVKYKGVKIGQVTGIYIRYNQPDDSEHIPITIEIDNSRLQNELGVAQEMDLSDLAVLQEQIAIGLRAKLQVQSFVTNMLYVELDYFPYSGNPEYIQQADDPLFAEIPTLRSDLAEVFNGAVATLTKISKINFQRIGRSVESILDQVDTKVSEIDVQAINNRTLSTLAKVEGILGDPAIQESIVNFNATMAKSRELMDSSQGFVENLDNEVAPFVADLKATNAKAQETMDELRRFGTQATDFLSSDSALSSQLENTLDEISEAARAIRVLADFIERNPSAFLTGKQAAQ